MSGEINSGRRRFLTTAGAAAVAIGASQLGLAGCTNTQSATARITGRFAASPGTRISFGPVAGTSTSFDSLKQINAGVLNVGYAEAGDPRGRPVILMHGFPYDIHSYVEVAPLLAAHGYRVIVPYFRGYGTATALNKTSSASDGARLSGRQVS